jgi:hypothetical protein
VTEVNGEQADYPGLRDVIDIPYKKNGKPGFVKMLVPFLNPIMVGEFVYHCHIVGHEDAGMMANIRVLPRQTAAEEAWDKLTRLAGLATPETDPSLTGGRDAPSDFDTELAANICAPGEVSPETIAAAVE